MDRDRNSASLSSRLDAWTIDDEAVTPMPEDLFKALVSRQRRRVLAVLVEQERVEVDDLSDLLVGSAATIQGPSGPDERAQVKIELVHAHLPLLVDAELIDYDRDEQEVRLRAIPEPVRQMIRFAIDYERILERNGLGSY